MCFSGSTCNQGAEAPGLIPGADSNLIMSGWGGGVIKAGSWCFMWPHMGTLASGPSVRRTILMVSPCGSSTPLHMNDLTLGAGERKPSYLQQTGYRVIECS